MLRDKKGDGLVEQGEFFTAPLDELHMQLGRIVAGLLWYRFGDQPCSFNPQDDCLWRPQGCAWYCFCNSTRLYHELQADITASNGEIGIVGGGKSPDPGMRRPIVEQFSAERSHQ